MIEIADVAVMFHQQFGNWRAEGVVVTEREPP
jgi:hypothetical protein